MKAVLWNKYGSADYLIYGEKEKPSIKDGEVLIKVKASTVTAGDCEIRSLNFPFLLKWMLRLYFGIKHPKDVVLGQELSGTIAEVGKDVTRFKVGDHVFGSSGFKLGGHGEYVALPEKTSMGAIIKKSDDMTFEEAAALPVGGMEALHLLKIADVKEGTSLLINGAGGSIGTAAIQFAKHRGAHVIAVDSVEKLDMLKRLGADEVIDYKKASYTQLGHTYDVVIDIVGKSKIFKTLSVLSKKGKFIEANPRFRHRLMSRFVKLSQKTLTVSSAEHTVEALEELTSLFNLGILKIEIDRLFPLHQVKEAHKYVEAGLKKGNVVIQVEESI